MWSRKESAFDKAILDRYNNDFVPYEKEYLEYNEKNPDRLFPKYDEKLNRIWE
tara:strand:- start:2441 stop:2599 length:159 start_codon:yes stop_codon:yes gene_type:complete